MINYTLVRSCRKTLALYIRGGALEVRAPLQATQRDIESFIAAKEKWITEKLQDSAEQQRLREDFSIGYGDKIMYRGKEYPLTAKPGNRLGFDGARFYLPPDLSAEEIKSACIKIYRMLAKSDLSEKVLNFAEQMKVQPSAIKINGAKSRWGSCSAKKSLNFSWRLIPAADELIDYVVVHELAHITEMNHSPRFWAVVESVLPDYKERRIKLKALQQKLSAENWD